MSGRRAGRVGLGRTCAQSPDWSRGWIARRVRCGQRGVHRPVRNPSGGADAERGAITIFVAVAVLGLLALAGLVVDGGAKVRAAQRADRVAAEAARAGGQAIDLTGLFAGEGVAVDRRAATAAAHDYLDRAGIEGSVDVLDGGATLRVTTHSSEPTVFLGLIGVPRLAVTGRAEVRLFTQREASR